MSAGVLSLTRPAPPPSDNTARDKPILRGAAGLVRSTEGETRGALARAAQLTVSARKHNLAN
jgi:hypothetical protein